MLLEISDCRVGEVIKSSLFIEIVLRLGYVSRERTL